MTVHAGIPVGTEAEVTVHPGFKGIMLNGRPAESGTLILPSGNHQVEWILETGE